MVAMNGTIMSGARVPYAVARDGYFFSSLAQVHPRFRTPSVAIIVQAVLAIILLLLGGNFRQLFSLTIFSEWLFYMISGSTIFVFRCVVRYNHQSQYDSGSQLMVTHMH